MHAFFGGTIRILEAGHKKIYRILSVVRELRASGSSGWEQTHEWILQYNNTESFNIPRKTLFSKIPDIGKKST